MFNNEVKWKFKIPCWLLDILLFSKYINSLKYQKIKYLMTKKESLSFEEALKRLENIVEGIEDDDKPLEESIKLYEEGILLANHCTGRLEDAKLRIEEVNRKQGGGADAKKAELNINS